MLVPEFRLEFFAHRTIMFTLATSRLRRAVVPGLVGRIGKPSPDLMLALTRMSARTVKKETTPVSALVVSAVGLVVREPAGGLTWGGAHLSFSSFRLTNVYCIER